MPTNVTLSYRGAENVPILRSRPRVAENITASGTSQQTTMVAVDDEYWTISTSVDIWVTFAANPTASAGTTWFVSAGQIVNFEAQSGDKAAVITG